MGRVACPGCGTQYPLKPEYAGKTVRCKRCGQTFRMPEPSPPAAEVPPPQDMTSLLDESLSAPSGDVSSATTLAPLPKPAKAKAKTTAKGSSDESDNKLLGWGITVSLLGIGSLILPLLGLQFRILARIGADHPVVGIVMTLIGALLVCIGLLREHGFFAGLLGGGGVVGVLLVTVVFVIAVEGDDEPPPAPAQRPVARNLVRKPLPNHALPRPEGIRGHRGLSSRGGDRPGVRKIPSNRTSRPPVGQKMPPTDLDRLEQLGYSAASAELTDMLGGEGGASFYKVDPQRRPVVGFRWTVGRYLGQDLLASIDPVFDRDTSGGGEGEVVLAKPGYAVGALKVRCRDYVNAVQPVFMRVKGKKLDPSDSYEGDWLGKPAGDLVETFGGSGKTVVGIHGSKGLILNMVGLVLATARPSGDELPAPVAEPPAPEQPVAERKPPEIPDTVPDEARKLLADWSKQTSKNDRLPAPIGEKVPPTDLTWLGHMGYLPRTDELTDMVGGKGGGTFFKVDRHRRPVVGFRWRIGHFAGQDLLKSLDPIFDRDTRGGEGEVILAKPGYAVGSLKVRCRDYVNAVQPIFMRVKGKRLDPSDSYEGDWLGKPAGELVETFGGSGKRVLGIHGSQGLILNMVGLVLEK
ncbi:MAG: hypothetical protein JW888_16230 [Pirellulales bacterium]|nr:hypothetical protein [Pirellulales bacterium]